MRWYAQQLKITVGFVTNCFRGQTNVTAFHVSIDVVAKGWPVVLLAQQFASLHDAKIAGQKIVVVTANQLCLNGFGYKW